MPRVQRFRLVKYLMLTAPIGRRRRCIVLHLHVWIVDRNLQRFQKCDAKRPCSTCKTAHKEEQCLYEENAQRNLIQSLVNHTRQLEARLASIERSTHNTVQPSQRIASTSSSDPASSGVNTGIDGHSTAPAGGFPISHTITPQVTLERMRLL